MATSHYDVVIAGAGLAGCAAAIRLRQLNITVCLVDDVKDTILKVGESLPGAAIRLLNRLGINDMNQLIPETDYSACVANVSMWGVDNWTYNDAIRNPENGGWHILRHKFDAALRKLAVQNGVAFYNAKIGKIIDNNDSESSIKTQYTITFKTKKANIPSAISSQWVIDATGRAGSIIKQLQIQRFKFEEQLSAIVWLKPNDTKNVDHTTRIKSVENGWWYSAKLPDNSRVIAFYGLAETISKIVKYPTLFIDEVNKSDLLKDPISEAYIAEGVIARNADNNKDLSTVRNTYKQKIEAVFTANQNSRKHFYTSELRYTKNPYWQQYLR